MTLSPPSTRAQQSSAFSPNSAALQAATRSSSKKVPPFPQQVPSTHHNTDKPLVGSESSIASSPTGGMNASSSGSLLAAQQSFLKEQSQKSHLQYSTVTAKSPSHSRSSVVAANLATERSRSPLKKSRNQGDKKEEEEVLPAKGTVDARRKLFQDHDVCQEASPIAGLRIKKVLPTHGGPSSFEFQVVNATSLEGISSVESSFGKNPNAARSGRSIPAVHTAASPDNPSLTAAILATQLYPSNSTQGSRAGSPLSKPASTSSHGSIPQKVPQKIFISQGDFPKLSLPLPRDAVGASSTGTSVSSNTEASNRNDALLAATLASQPKRSSSPQAKPPRPPRPPPPRRAQTSWSVPTAPNDLISGHEDDSDTLSLNSTATGYSKYQTARSLMSFKNDRSSSPTTSMTDIPLARSPYLQPTGQLSRQNTGGRSSTALTAALLSGVSLQNSSSTLAHHNHNHQSPLSIPRRFTGDPVRAGPLVPSHVTSTASKKPPAPPVPRRRRRKSLPLPPKTGLRETMRKPPKVPLNEISPPGHKPRLVKHHPHKHSEGERRRWRHFVTEPERKRYEGLWAANKGLFLVDPKNMITISPAPLRMKYRDPHNLRHVWSSTPNYMELLADCVDSLVVRDIWARSRLPSDYLEDIWNLVDRGEKGHLSRDEFLVGTWLIDQSLKGRKLPPRVQDEVWQSVRRLGVKLQPASINDHRG